MMPPLVPASGGDSARGSGHCQWYLLFVAAIELGCNTRTWLCSGSVTNTSARMSSRSNFKSCQPSEYLCATSPFAWQVKQCWCQWER
jgi:hypothetical protein